MKDSEFVETPDYLFQDSGYGLFISEEDTIDDELPKYECLETVTLPKDGDGYKDGWYLVYTSLTKYSIELWFEPEGGPFDANKLVLEYRKFDLGELEDDLYGPLHFNVLEGFKYDGSTLEEYDGELSGSDVDREVHIVQVKNHEIHLVYKNRNREEETWGDIQE